MSSFIASAAWASPRFPLGVYAGNPNGTYPVDEASFEAQFQSFVTVMNGATPAFMNAFVDFTQDPSQWPSNSAWTAWSWTQSPVVGTGIVPVIGVPMSDNAHWASGGPGYTNDDFFKGIIAGAYDSDYTGVVDAWAASGFKTMYLRLGWEMDLTSFPWFMGSDSATQADWVKAFRHLATLMRKEATADGAHALIVWNPDEVNWTNLTVKAAYPGDPYVDVISVDSYSPVYPTTLYDWALNNWTYDASALQWWPKAANRRHYWDYPSANGWEPHGNGSGWGFQETVTLAKNHHKPLAISESGAGGDGVTNGPEDDAAFPAWLANQLAAAERQGIAVPYVMIWDVWTSSGNWDFSTPGAGKPLEAAAWAEDFGNPVN